jgi:hypothetical protein
MDTKLDGVSNLFPHTWELACLRQKCKAVGQLPP